MYEAELVELYLLLQYQASDTECVPLTGSITGPNSAYWLRAGCSASLTSQVKIQNKIMDHVRLQAIELLVLFLLKV